MSDTVLVAILISIAPTIAAIAGLIVSLKNRRKLDAVHTLINSGLSRQLDQAKESGRLEEKDRKNTENKKNKK